MASALRILAVMNSALTLSDRLALIGYSHRRGAGAGRHFVYDRSGALIGELTAAEAVDLLNRVVAAEAARFYGAAA